MKKDLMLDRALSSTASHLALLPSAKSAFSHSKSASVLYTTVNNRIAVPATVPPGRSYNSGTTGAGKPIVNFEHFSIHVELMIITVLQICR